MENTDSKLTAYVNLSPEPFGNGMKTDETKYYQVRKSWSDRDSQIGTFTVFQNAINSVDANPGYAAFDDAGNQVYPKESI